MAWVPRPSRRRRLYGLVLITWRVAAGRGVAHIDALNERLSERGMLALAGVAESLQQRVALARGRPRRSPGAREQVVGRSLRLVEQPALTEVRTLLAAGSPEQLTLAAELLAESRAHALARNSNRRLIEIDALQALVLAAQRTRAARSPRCKQPWNALRQTVRCGCWWTAGRV